jgi:cytochrome c-type biogenesis protein
MSIALQSSLAFLAGALTIASPCVLPLVPIVLIGARRKHPLAPLMLGLGLVFTFTSAAFILAIAGPALGLDPDIVRVVTAGLMVALGLILIVPLLETRFSRVFQPLAAWGQDQQQGTASSEGLPAQFMLGALLGLVWSPCVGPTLGAATLLAAQGQNLGEAGLVMLAFGCGIATVLVLISLVSRTFVNRIAGAVIRTGKRSKQIMGLALAVTGIFVLSGTDRIVEGWAVQNSPAWLSDLTTSI